MTGEKIHTYSVNVKWTGDQGKGTADYHQYGRDHVVEVSGKPLLHGSADPAFQGDPSRHNPEELLVAAASACHMLWYLHLCAQNGIVVTHYVDSAVGKMRQPAAGAGRFIELLLRPRVTVTSADAIALAKDTHEDAHASCFIANSFNFPVHIAPEMVSGGNSTSAG